MYDRQRFFVKTVSDESLIPMFDSAFMYDLHGCESRSWFAICSFFLPRAEERLVAHNVKTECIAGHNRAE